ncbi:phosphate-import permease protein PhnE [Maritalea myrionectae]|uniref:Phosphate-import permease protein PhnE n=2 Tax=Maritalea myrionectae TaxID=454601 RepID=A0A2R4MAP9_9HYPH|nr:phosphonate ABC transporter, permease protein PhnE [Maritalea myrionectae]AVX03101.1 phosphate-import permease protein PhnE [Maritalea myrionectae]
MTMLTTTNLTAERQAELKEQYAEVFHKDPVKKFRPLAIVAALLAYLVACFFFFNIPQVFSDAKWDRAGLYMADWVSWQAQPKFRFRDDGLELQYPRFSPLGAEPDPSWVIANETADAYRVDFGPSDFIVVQEGLVEITKGGQRFEVVITDDEALLPPNATSAFEARNGRVKFSFGFAGNIEIRNTQVRVWRRFWGWENFFFDPSSAFWGMNGFEVISTIAAGPQLEAGKSNLSVAINDFLYNAEWQHADVFVKLLQTIVMAFVGTLFAGILAFPLAFIAARNITRSNAANWFMKRAFDFLRSVDMLIWALFFTRSFGPGPIAGIAAIFFTDTGTLGKLYSEALENVDDKQREGVKSLGASPVEVQRFGVVPQVLPLFASQALYFWESNTRSATIIGAVGAGGIGLKLLEAMRTGTDWENVGYMVILILIVVFVFDNISNYLRTKLIGEEAR